MILKLPHWRNSSHFESFQSATMHTKPFNKCARYCWFCSKLLEIESSVLLSLLYISFNALCTQNNLYFDCVDMTQPHICAMLSAAAAHKLFFFFYFLVSDRREQMCVLYVLFTVWGLFSIKINYFAPFPRYFYSMAIYGHRLYCISLIIFYENDPFQHKRTVCSV